MKRILVTGGAGFIGSAVVRHIIAATNDAGARCCILAKTGYGKYLEDLLYARPRQY